MFLLFIVGLCTLCLTEAQVDVDLSKDRPEMEELNDLLSLNLYQLGSEFEPEVFEQELLESDKAEYQSRRSSTGWDQPEEINDDRSYTQYKTFTPEDSCSRVGGMCVEKQYCPQTQVSETGSCPKQAGNGAVCCYSGPTWEKRCSKLGGVCRTRCPKTHVLSNANNCPASSVCCVLVF